MRCTATHLATLTILAASPIAAQGLGSFTTSGRGCPNRCSSPAIYEILPAGGWDLDGLAPVFNYATATRTGAQYGVTTIGRVGMLPLSSAATTVPGVGDDSVSVGIPVGFSFRFRTPSGRRTTTAVDVSSNGYVYLESGTISSSRCCSGEDGYLGFLNDTASIAALGTDLDGRQGQIRYETMFGTSPILAQSFVNVLVIEWSNVPELGASVGNTFQVQLWEDGEIVIAHGTMAGSASTRSALVGFSPGGGAQDCAGIDFSADLPFAPAFPYRADLPQTLRSSGGFEVGTTFVLDIDNSVRGSSWAMFIGNSTLDFPLNLIGGPDGCSLLVNPFFTITGSNALVGIDLRIPNSPGLVGSTLQFQGANVDLTQAGTYAIPVFTTDRGTLTIGQRRSDDECDGATQISNGEILGDNFGATTSALTGSCGSTGADVWYRYTATCTGTATFSLCQGSPHAGADFDTTLAAFSGDCSNLTEITCNDDTCGRRSEIAFPVTNGTTYYIALGGFAGATGSFAMAVSCQ